VSDDEAFIRRIVDSPGDDLPRLVYADWLDERNDPRGAYLRAEVEWARPWQTGEQPVGVQAMRELADGLEPAWVARVSRPPAGVCCDHVRFTECGPVLIPADISRIEHRFGIRFPASYRAFLLNYNAGRTIPSEPLPAGSKLMASCEAVEEFYSIGRPAGDTTHLPDLESITEYLWPSEADDPDEHRHLRGLLPLGIPFAQDDILYLGVAGDPAGRVFYFVDLTHAMSDPDNLSELAPSLPDFLATVTASWVE
jgi:uncharacterized protein (TIGR02996 family)